MIKKTKPKKIIIIGAGLAGLAAYERLNKYGFNVTILEARNRCGGRIWTEDKLGIPFSVGAGWIHGIKDNPIAKLAKHFHTRMAIVDPNKFIIFDRHGRLIPDDDIRKFNIKFDMLLKQAKEQAYHAEQDISLFSALSKIIKPENLSPLEQDMFEKKYRSFEGYIGAGCEVLSARHWDQEESWPGDHCYLPSTYQPIIDGLQKDCSIRLHTVVTKINMRAEDVEIIAEDEVFYADAVIITLPLGVLKKNVVTFNPPLPDDKQKAIQHLGMGVFNITAIKFPTLFWPKDVQAIYFTPVDALSISIFFNLYPFTQQPILIGYSGGERARQLEDFADSELIEKTMQSFKKFFGAKLPMPESYLNTRWSRDPFSYGSYSYIQTGASGDDYEAMAAPISDRLFFAGEATCPKYPATTHGAYLSGIREAERINKLLSQGKV